MDTTPYIISNILNIESGVIIHQCNCQGAYNAGIAKKIATRYPLAKTVYLEHLSIANRQGVDPLGTICTAQVEPGLFIRARSSETHYL